MQRPCQQPPEGIVFIIQNKTWFISQDLLSFTNKVFSTYLSKDKWKELTTSYTQIKDTESSLVAPTMELKVG